MKRLLVIGLLASGSCLAQDFYCPHSITCTRDNDVSSCVINGGSNLFNKYQLDRSVIKSGEYDFSIIEIYADPSTLPYCRYDYKPSSHLNWSISLRTDKSTIYADYLADGNKWYLYNNNGACSSSSSQDCPFTDQPMMRKWLLTCFQCGNKCFILCFLWWGKELFLIRVFDYIYRLRIIDFACFILNT